MDTYERELLLKNPFIQLMLSARGRPAARAEAALTQSVAVATTEPSDEELQALEKALNDALGRLAPEKLRALFARTLDITELSEVFTLTVTELARAVRTTAEGRALGLEHLWGWYWERDVIAYRRFLATGRRSHDVLDQLPSFWRPGVEAKPFWSLDELDPAFRALEEHAPAIRAELEQVLASDAWLPYRGVRGVRDEPIEHPTRGDESSWNGFFFYHPFRGRFPDNHARCPVTSRVVEALPGLCRRELALFSALTPGAVVPPHQGPFNGRLRVHLALTGSEGAFLRVGTQIRQWQDGKVLVFDDSFEHQVCHTGSRVRVVLMFNVVQPGVPLDVVDRAAQATSTQYVETPGEAAAREALARTAWWK
jgi:hypothetical protein